MSWSTRFVLVKLFVGFSIFDFVSFLLKFIFLFNKMHAPFDFKEMLWPILCIDINTHSDREWTIMLNLFKNCFLKMS